MPLYTRAAATAKGISTARVRVSPRTTAERARSEASTASAPYRQMAAAVCPEGKLEVGGAWSRWLTGGRRRSTSSVVARKMATSPATATATSIGSRQRRHTHAVIATVTTARTVTVMVSDNQVVHLVRVLRSALR